MSGTFGWYLIQATGGIEVKAADALLAEGVKVWWPQFRAVAVHARQMTIRTRALFPGYLFAWCEPADFAKIRKAKDVRLVRFGDGENAPKVPERIMDDLAIACQRGAFDTLPKGHKPVPEGFPQGSSVRLHDERFGEIIGKIKAQPHGQRAEIFVEWLGREMRMSVSLDKLEPVAQP